MGAKVTSKLRAVATAAASATFITHFQTHLSKNKYLNHKMNFTVEGVQAMQDTAESMAEQKKQCEKEMRDMMRERPKREAAVVKRLQKDMDAEKKASEDRESKLLSFKIERRFKAFPWLREVVPQPTQRSTLAEKREIDDLQKLEMDLRGAESRLNKLINTGLTIATQTWGDGSSMTFLPEQARLNLSNAAEYLNSPLLKPEIDQLITETIIEYPTFGQMGLTMRWITTIFGAALLIHQLNTESASAKAVMEKLAEATQQHTNASFLPQQHQQQEGFATTEITEEAASAPAPKPSKKGRGRACVE